MSGERTGVLLIRVWMEQEPPTLRARIIQRSNVTGLDQTVTSATSVEDITAAVTRWLQALLNNQGHRNG